MKRISTPILLILVFWTAAAARDSRTFNYLEDTSGLNIPMVFIDATTFEMGATPEQGATEDDERLHTVSISPFYIGATEITQKQWRDVMGTSLEDMYRKLAPDHEYGRYGVGDDRPMYYVSWHDAVAFCRKLSVLTGLNYRLPTESEWELAARGGDLAPTIAATRYAGSDTLDLVGWYVDNADMDRFNKGNPETHPVSTRRANAAGIFDMSGNVCEWVIDLYSPYPTTPVTDPIGVPHNGDRCYRGGAFRSNSNYCRTAFRNSNDPGFACEYIGFRIVCQP